jgi:uncharacterized protein YjiS (DUF1127 family)
MEMHTKESLLYTHGIENLDGSPARSAGGSLTRFLRRLWERHISECRIRRQISHLQNCDDRMLHDIGISRWEIEAIVRGGRSAAQGVERRSK